MFTTKFHTSSHSHTEIRCTLLITGVFFCLCILLFCLKKGSTLTAVTTNNGHVFANTDTTIGNGSISGSCIAGKKCLPIYSVDMNSRISHANTTDSNLNASGKYISLSFDAAWGADDTIRILDILDAHHIKVTFFMTGGWVDSYPDMVREIYARGHDLGNHSQNHKKMSTLDSAAQTEEIMSVYHKIKELTGYESFLFRPPYGDYNNTLITTTYSNNYYPIQWSVDSLDWKDYGVDSIVKTVTNHKALGNGAIILMHNGAKYTADALDTIITTLQQQGYTFIPISQLIIRENFHMDANGTQIADDTTNATE